MTADRRDDAAVRRQIERDYRSLEAEGLSPLVPRVEVARRNRIAVHTTEHRPQPHELRRGTGETPAAWHGGAPS